MRRVGRRERFVERRRHLGFTQESLAERLEVSVSSVAQWERGVSTPGARHRPLLAKILQVSLSELDCLLDPDGKPSAIQGHLVPPQLMHFVSLEQAAGEIWSYEPISVPGILQTRRYAEWAFRSHHYPLTEEQIRTRTEIRLARRDALTRDAQPVSLRTVIDESVLLRIGTERCVLVEQFDHLTEMAHLPNIDIRVLPLTAAAHCVAWGSFRMLLKPGAEEPFMFCTEDAASVHYGELPVVLEQHRTVFRWVVDHSLSPEESLRRIIRAREDLR